MQMVVDVFAQIFGTLWAHKLRSFLTMFGIAWGVGSLLLLVGLGEGFRTGNKRNLSEYGENIMMLFPGRAPEGHALLTSFVGGATNAAALGKSPEALAAQVHRELAPMLGIRNDPAFSNVLIWPRAIPQYALGHLALLQQIDVRLASLPLLTLTGNAYRGVGVADVVRDAGAQIDRLLHRGNE